MLTALPELDEKTQAAIANVIPCESRTRAGLRRKSCPHRAEWILHFQSTEVGHYCQNLYAFSCTKCKEKALDRDADGDAIFCVTCGFRFITPGMITRVERL